MNQETRYLRVAVPTPLRRLFDYLPPIGSEATDFVPGIRVRVPFQSRTMVGILIEAAAETQVPTNKLKRALEFIDKAALLPKDIYELCHWAADYYHYSLGEILFAALPALLRKGKPPIVKTKAEDLPSRPLGAAQEPTSIHLNSAQAEAVQLICAQSERFKVMLLDGITGSGKTEVYLRSIANMLQKGRQVLVLVPEISLTPQTIARFRARFDTPVVALHSSLTDKERLSAWLAAKSGDAPIVIGTRSAIFTPFKHLGMIIVDEEHDTSFKQQDRFRYHARDLAIMRAQMNKIPVVLGSATPSLETLLNVKRKRFDYISLPERAGNAQLPTFQMLDIRQLPTESGLSIPLLDAIRVHLDANHQVLLYLNRRGFAPVLYCTACQWIVGCQRCDVRMVYHRHPPLLKCHHCDAQASIPTHCAQCGETALEPVGLGTQRIEQTLKKHFLDIPIIRVDRDSTQRKGKLHDVLEEIHAQPKAILIGTQMLAKGHHFPNVTLVGVIDVDSGLLSADYRAVEQMGQLLIQVAGRAGRAEAPGTVLIQTRHIEHPLLQTLIQKGYPAFANILLNERVEARLPPFSHFAVLRAEAYQEERASGFLKRIKNMCQPTNEVTLLGPVPALIAKRKGLHCQHLLLKADRRLVLQQYVKTLVQQIEKSSQKQPVKWLLDIDPVEI